MTNPSLSAHHDLLTLANSGCKVNEISIDELLQYYYSTKFIYEAKAKRITPYLSLILANWKKALKAGEQIFKIITYTSEDQHFASAMLWRYTDTSWVAQHLISTGSRISHIPMLAFTGGFVATPDRYKTNHVYSWYRPDNKLPNLFFGGSQDVLGNTHTSLTRWNYYEGNKIIPQATPDIRVEKVNPGNYASFETFARDGMDTTWIDSEEFNSIDIELEGLNTIYKEAGLKRNRTILMAFQNKEEIPSAIAICNRASLGLNLSFLENRVVLLFKKDLSKNEVIDLIHALLVQVIKQYPDLPLDYIPLLVPEEHSILIEEAFHFPLIKKYNQCIWSKAVYPGWYNYVKDLRAQHDSSHSTHETRNIKAA